MLNEVEKDANENRFEDVILPLLVLAADVPLKYLPDNDPFGARVNYGANDSFNKDKLFLYAPKSYTSLALSPSSSNSITRPFILPILQFVIKSDQYITSERLKEVPFIAQCLRFAVHFEDSGLKVLRSSFWELAVKVIKAVEFMKTRESVAIFDQLGALAWHDNDEECTEAVWGSTKGRLLSREEVYAYIALMRGMDRGITISSLLKSILRDVIKSLMKSINHRKSSDDCMAVLKLLNSWIRKGKDGPMEVQLVRMMIKDVMETYDSFLAKSPSESMGETTMYLLTLGQEVLAVTSHLKSVKSSLESILDRVNSNISKSGKDGSDSLSEYVKFLTDFLTECEDSPFETKDTPWFIVFRAVLVRCFVLKMKMEWVEKTDLLRPLFKKMTALLKTVSQGLETNTSCDYMNECIPTLTEVVYLLITSKMDSKKKWECMVGLCEAEIPSSIIRSISMMKNQSARTQCSSFISKMVDPLTEIINSHPPKTTLSHFESFFTVALTIDLPQEIRESVCTLWKYWYGSRMEELSGASISEGLMGRLKWFNLPIPPNTINDKFEVKLEGTGGSPKKAVSNASLLKRGNIFSSPAPIKKAKSANDALKMIDLMDEDSVQFFPVEESPKKKQRMTEKQKEMLTEKKDRLPFMEDESRTGMAKIPSDMFEMSVSGVEGSSKGSGSRRGQMKTDFSDLTMEKKSDSNEVAKESKGSKKKEGERKEEKKKEGKKEEKTQKKKMEDDNIEESSSSGESGDEETGGEEKGERKGGRRKSKTPKKMVAKTREVKSPSRKKLDAAMSVDSPKRKNRRLGKNEENGKKVDENAKKEEDKKEGEEREKEESVETMEVKGVEEVEMSEIPSEVKETATPKRSHKITLSPLEKGEKEGETVEEADLDSSILVCESADVDISSIPVCEISPMKAVGGQADPPVPSTPANRGTFEPVGILSSAKKNRSEKKKGGVHFEEKIVERSDEEKEKEEETKEEGEGEGVKIDKMVFPLLRHNEESIDTITLKLGVNSRMVKRSLEKIGVKTVGQLAAMSAKEINAVMGIKPPTMVTVKTVLDGVWARCQKSGSKALPPICTPEKKEEDTVASPKKVTDSLDRSPVARRSSPTKSKSRKRLALSDSPIRVKKLKEEEEEKKETVEVMEEEEKENEEESGEKKEEVAEEKIVIEEKSDEVEKKEEKSDEVMVIDEEKENKENGKIDEDKKNEEKGEVEEEKTATTSSTSLKDVLSFIDGLKGGSLQTLLDAQDQITVSLMEALREVRRSQSTN